MALILTLGCGSPDVISNGKSAGEKWSGNAVKMTFCWCPAGNFVMGSPEDEPGRDDFVIENQVDVTITKGFWLGQFEVTQGQWEQVLGSAIEHQRSIAYAGAELHGEGSNYPMYYVSFDDASDFCQKLTKQERAAGRLPETWEYRLPTEAQWEYACRAGTTTATSFGEKMSSRQANFDGNEPYNGADPGPYLNNATPVGSYQPNAWGLYDLHGNVEEWCRDRLQWDAVEPSPGGIDPEITKEGNARALRGGGFVALGKTCRSAHRSLAVPDFRTHHIGFRVALVQIRN